MMMLSRLTFRRSVIQRTSAILHKARYFGCYTTVNEEAELREDYNKLGGDFRALEKKYKLKELELCKASTLLYKFKNKMELSNTDNSELDRLLIEHKKHRQEDIIDEIKQAEEYIDNTQHYLKVLDENQENSGKDFINNVNKMIATRKELKLKLNETMERLKKLNSINKNSDEIMIR